MIFVFIAMAAFAVVLVVLVTGESDEHVKVSGRLGRRSLAVAIRRRGAGPLGLNRNLREPD